MQATRTLALVLSVVSCAWPALAAADDKPPAKDDHVYGTTLPPKFGENVPKDYHSSQYFAFEFKMGAYSPNIDASPGLHGATPFSDLFNPQGKHGRPPGRLLTSIELDTQFLHKVGSLGVGTSVGYYRRTTHSFQYPGGGQPQVDPATGQFVVCQVGSCVRSGDQTALNVIPLEAMLVYRFDYLMLRWRVPFVPYMKLGLAYYIWIIENGGGAGSVSTWHAPNGMSSARGYGGTFGWVLNPGLAFQLDCIDPTTARTMDAELGINHAYIFAELHYANVNGFGASDKMTLSDTTWNVGLSFEF
jgi:hypothetical protein